MTAADMLHAGEFYLERRRNGVAERAGVGRAKVQGAAEPFNPDVGDVVEAGVLGGGSMNLGFNLSTRSLALASTSALTLAARGAFVVLCDGEASIHVFGGFFFFAMDQL